MPGELTTEALLAAAVSTLVERIADPAAKLLSQKVTDARVKLRGVYKTYLSRILQRNGQAKSFFFRDAPTPLYDFYVPLDIRFTLTVLTEPGVDALISISPRVVITGTAGSGKTIFTRHLIVSCVKEKQRIPVFVELRRFNATKITFFDLLLETLQQDGFDFEAPYVKCALQNGHFALFLDGLDEVMQSRRPAVDSAIQQLAARYPLTVFVVSSRPDPSLGGWQDFVIGTLCPLTLQKACAVVEKLPVGDDVIRQVTKDLEDDLFERHEPLLSNPLLLSIMLLTYRESADIPSRISIFYGHAYTALFQRHDALKSVFRRDRCTNLDIQDFGRLFSAFGLVTYDAGVVAISETVAMEYISQSVTLTGIEVAPHAYLEDCLRAVCLLVEDGSLVTFPHRSFQEYFTARFISENSEHIQRDLLARFRDDLDSDNVFSLLFEIRPDVIEREVVLPGIIKLFEQVSYRGSVDADIILQVIRALITDFRRLPGGGFETTLRTTDGWTLFPVLDLIEDLYGINHCTIEDYLESGPGYTEFGWIAKLKPRSRIITHLKKNMAGELKIYLDELSGLGAQITARQRLAKESLSELLRARPPHG